MPTITWNEWVMMTRWPREKSKTKSALEGTHKERFGKIHREWRMRAKNREE